MTGLQAADTSIYTVTPPPLRGLIPRLAREVLVDVLKLRWESCGGGGGGPEAGGGAEALMVSGELQGALALGFDGEVGNFILRSVASHLLKLFLSG